MASSFDGLTIDNAAFDPNPIELISKREYIERTGLDGVEVKDFGDRPQGYTARVVLQRTTHALMDTAVKAIKAKVGIIGTLVYEGVSFTGVELQGFTPGRRRTSPQGPVQNAEIQFHKVQP